MNPNNCSTCDHKKHPDGGHCYMFHDEPTEICMQHTQRKKIALVGRPTVLGAATMLSLLLSKHAQGEEIDDD